MKELSKNRMLFFALALALALTGCTGGWDRGETSTASTQTASAAPTPTKATATVVPTATPAATPSETPSETPSPTAATANKATSTPAAKVSPKPTAKASPTPVAATAEATPSAAVDTPAPAPYAPPVGYDYTQTVPESAPVGDDYFADAAFVGDSRIDGFRIFSGLKQGDFIVKTGMSIFRVAKDQLTYNGKKMTALQALGQNRYGKIYLSMGVNELGMNNNKGYHDKYAQFIDSVRAQQPQAKIYVQLIIPVNEKKSHEKGYADYINNQRVAEYNEQLRKLGVEKQVFLLDPAQVLVDGTGEPPYDSVADGVHFQRAPYEMWLKYLKCHTV